MKRGYMLLPSEFNKKTRRWHYDNKQVALLIPSLVCQLHWEFFGVKQHHNISQKHLKDRWHLKITILQFYLLSTSTQNLRPWKEACLRLLFIFLFIVSLYRSLVLQVAACSRMSFTYEASGSPVSNHYTLASLLCNWFCTLSTLLRSNHGYKASAFGATCVRDTQCGYN